MPYIDPDDRPNLDNGLEKPTTAGELNYRLTMECLDYVDHAGVGYDTFNEVVGVLECLKLEFYRRAVAPYENRKIKLNTDVYPQPMPKKIGEV